MFDKFPNINGGIVILSGGMDSTTTLRLAIEKYSRNDVIALTFQYGQKQKIEVEMARKTCEFLDVDHRVIDIGFLGNINKGFSSNTDNNIETPTAKEVEGLTNPSTYVSNRNMILLSIAASLAEVQGLQGIFTGFQRGDSYGYYDCTRKFVDKFNSLLDENPNFKIKVYAPFVDCHKSEEIQAILDLDGNVDLYKNTITCYNPQGSLACGICPSCDARLTAFRLLNLDDPASYIYDNTI